jgi:hypothetical protein
MMAGIGRKIVLVIIGLSICLLVMISLVKFGNLLAFLMVFPWIVDLLVNAGLDIWLARLITVPIACIMVAGLGLALSFSATKRNAGLAIFACGMMLWSLAMFHMTKENLFDPISGHASKCYAITPDGYEFVNCAWKYHPLYGSAVQPATKEMASAEWVAKNGLSHIQTIKADKNLRFFSQDGSPLVWYYQHSDGSLELFSQPGRHPQLNVPLKPVDAAVVAAILAQIKKDDQIDNQSYNPKQKISRNPAIRFDGLKDLKKTLQQAKVRE